MSNVGNAAGRKGRQWVMPVAIVAILIIAIATVSWSKTRGQANGERVKIGIVTDLTGPAAYWGESSRQGAELAKKELEQKGYKVDLVYEDYQLDATKALTAAQTLVNVDNVNAVYAEFNPAAVSIGSFMKSQNKVFVYDAAVTSPLDGNNNAFKTYLDYQAGGKAVAEKFKAEGITKMGVLKVNLEAGDLFLKGVKEVYGDDTIVESYDLGATDLSTQVLKLKEAGAGAVLTSAFEADTLAALKAMQTLEYHVPYGTVDDSITDNVKTKYPNEIKGAWTFGFPDVNADFEAKLKANSTKTLATEYGAAITYTHVKQMVEALDQCKNDTVCASGKIAKSAPDNTIGFNKFVNQIADLNMVIKNYK